MTDTVDAFIAAAEALARSANADYPGLHEAESVPEELWAKLSGAGLLGLRVPSEYGGAALDLEDVGRIARAFAKASGNQGLVTTWLGHNLMADWVIGHFGNADQQAALFPNLATGAATIAFAVSEPGAGAHPKKLSATAREDGDQWRLNGAKAYVTNGPIATHLAIVAITNAGAPNASTRGRKAFGAFLVPKDAPGLTIRPSEHVDFLKPNGHASLDLEDVTVPASARLGGEGDIYPLMVKPLRDHEDRVGAWSRLGAFEHLISKLAALPDGALHAGGVAARLLALATMLEHDKTDKGLLAVRAIFEDIRAQVALADLTALDPAAQALARDLDKLGGVARYAVEAKFQALGRSIANCA